MHTMGNVLYPLILSVLCCACPVLCIGQGASFAAHPVELFCSEDPIRSIAFRPSNQTATRDLIVCAGTDTGKVTILRAFQNGQYATQEYFLAGPFGANEMVYNNPIHIVPGDLEPDGDTDVVIYWNRNNMTIPEQFMSVLDAQGSLVLSVIDAQFGHLGGSFESYRARPHLFDVNGDGALDVVFDGQLVNLFNPSLQYSTNKVLLATPDYQYNIATTPLSPTSFIRHHDLDGDGQEELFRDTWAGNTAILQRDQSMNFIPVDTIASPLPSPLELADVNGDGIEDILLGSWVSVGFPFVFRTILLNDTWITNPVVVYEQAAGRETRASVNDFDLDGMPDLLLWSGSYATNDDIYSVVRGTGTLPMDQEPQQILQCDQRFHLVEDVDGDGAADLVIYDRNCIKWLRNITFSTGMSEQVNEGISVRPNPAQHRVTVSSTNGSSSRMRIVGLLGQEVITVPVIGPETTIDLHGLPAGVYFVHALDQQGAATRSHKLIICN